MSDTSNQKRQPKGIPVGGEFAANEHDEAGALTTASTVPYPITNEGSSVDNIYPIGFPITGETHDQVQWAIDHDATLVVDMDEGTFPLSGDDLESTWDDLAPGEGFAILGAYRNDITAERNPYGASAAAIAEYDEIGRLLRSDKESDNALAEERMKIAVRPENKGDYYAAGASYVDLTPDTHERVQQLLEKHDVSRAAVEREIANEFGIPLPFTAPDGEERTYQEHPNRILNRITDDYLEEVFANAAHQERDNRQDFR